MREETCVDEALDPIFTGWYGGRVMRYEGKAWEDEDWWHIEVPKLGAYTQGKSRDDAFVMIADAIESPRGSEYKATALLN